MELIDGVRYISIEGRIKDLINRGGEKINAEEVELLLMRHPGIVTAAVVAMPDPRLGERACAVVVARGEPLSLIENQQHLEAHGTGEVLVRRLRDLPVEDAAPWVELDSSARDARAGLLPPA